MEKSAGGMPDAPPSYEQSTGGAPYPGAQPQGAGGFVPGAPPPDPTKGMAPGYYPGQVPPPMAGQVPPPGQGMPPPMGQPQPPQQVVVVVSAPNYGPHPIDMMCPHCQCQIRTSTESEPGVMAWILAGVLCVVGCIPCCLIPFCMNSMNDTRHKCPSCKVMLGRYKGGM